MSQSRTIAMGRAPISFFSGWSMIGWTICLILLASDQWILGPCLFVLLFGLNLLSRDAGPPVVAAAFSYQWLQVTIALFYFEVTRRQIVEMRLSHYQPMIFIGLSSIIAFFGGYWILRQRSMKSGARTSGPSEISSLGAVSTVYIGALAMSLLIQRVAFTIPALAQILSMLGFARYAVLYALVTRLCKPSPRWNLILLVLCAEMLIGFSGYFASFRESLVFIGIAIVVSMRTRGAAAWVTTAIIGIIAFYAAITWTTIKPMIRKEYSYSASMGERLARVADVIGPALTNPPVSRGTQVDKFVSRMWQVYFPALAVAHVPAVVPHENGQILLDAVKNTVMPRAFFPDKGVLPSESEKVRKYAGVWVSGRETHTSWAFGYTAESYVDFGWPLMLVPIFALGALIGYGDRLMGKAIGNASVLEGVRVVFLWSTMYLFETSWVILIGTITSLFIVLCAAGAAFERVFGLLMQRERRRLARRRIDDTRHEVPLGPSLRDARRIRSG